MKKGFTIVELAIVLVVIGIILGMAVKGKALVDAARMRAEVAKMNKYEAAAYIYYADTNNMPGTTSATSAIISLKTFVEKELLTNGDALEKIGGAYWGTYRCNVSSDNVTFVPSATGGNVCVTGISTDPRANDTATVAQIPSRLACNIEIMKDDENGSNGEGRGWDTHKITVAQSGSADDTLSIDNYRNCDNYTTGAKTWYAFRVF